MPMIRGTSTLLVMLALGAVATADPVISVYNLTIGTNKTLHSLQRMERCEVTGTEFCRVICEEGGSQVELFPFRNGKVRIWIYDAVEHNLVEEIRVNICKREIIAKYDTAHAKFKDVAGLVIDIEDNELVFSGELFSLSAYQELQALAEEGTYQVKGLRLHPWVDSILASSPSAMGPGPGQVNEPPKPPPTEESPAEPSDPAAGAGDGTTESAPAEGAPAEGVESAPSDPVPAGEAATS